MKYPLRLTLFLVLVLSPTASLTSEAQNYPSSGPIRATAGQVIRHLRITSTSGPCITVDNVADVWIDNVDIGPCAGPGIYVTGSGAKRLRITNSYIHDMGKRTSNLALNSRLGVFIVTGPSDVLIQGNSLARNESHIYAVGGTSNIRVVGNYFLNPMGPFPRGQCVQFDNTTGGSISDNRCEGVPDRPNAPRGQPREHEIEDNINLFNSRNILVARNWIRGGDSGSGCGILLADANGANNVAEDNVIIRTSQCSIGIAGGTGTIARRNKALDTNLVNGRSSLYVWQNGGSTVCSGHAVADNVISNLYSSGQDLPFWNGGNCGPITMSGNIFGSAARPLLTPDATKLPPPAIPPLPYESPAPPPPPAPAPAPLPTPSLSCSGIGSNNFYGCYYDNPHFAGLALTRTDSALTFDWGNGSPAAAIAGDTFSARWEGDWTFSTAGIYRFSATADDGVRVWVDGALIVDKWIDQAATTYTADRYLAQGNHRVKVEYYENTGAAAAKLSWTLLPAATPPPPAPPTAPAPSDMAALWTLDEGVDRAILDSSGNDLHGLRFNATWTTGKLGKALAFDGTGDYVHVNGLMDTLQSITVSAWVNLTAPDTNGADVLNIGNYLGLRLDDPVGGSRGFYYDGLTWRVTNTNHYLAGAGWHHVAYTVDRAANMQKYYIDGVEKAASSHTQPIQYTGLGSHTKIGTHANGSTNFDFNGSIDEVLVYARALNASEIKTLFSAGTSVAGLPPSTAFDTQLSAIQVQLDELRQRLRALLAQP